MSEFAPREEASAEGVTFPPRVEQPLARPAEQPLAQSEGSQLPFREDLPVPEPWSRSMWEVGKRLPLTLGLMYGVQRLVMPGDGLGWSWFATMGGFFFVQGVFERRRGTLNSQWLLGFGGVTSGVAALIAGIGLVGSERDLAIMGGIFGAFGAITLIAGLRARMLERERHEQFKREQQSLAPVDGAIPVATLRSRLDRFRERMKRFNKALIVGFGTVLATTLGGITLSGKLGWPESVDIGLFVFFWAGIGGLTWYSNRLTRKFAREEHLVCPSCQRPLLSALGSQRLMTQLEDLGRCPQCAARITVEVL